MNYLLILRRLVDLQQFAGLKENARRYFDETGDRQALPLLALALAQLGEYRDAFDTAQLTTRDMTVLDVDGRVDLAGVWCALLRIDEALALLEPVLLQRPDHALALARMAWCRMHQGQSETAIELYRRSAELAPQRLPVWHALARLNTANRDFAAAQQALDTAIERLGAQQESLPESAIDLLTAQLRSLQLEIWVMSGQGIEAEQWLEARRVSLPEDDWVALLTCYASLLAGEGQHAGAEAALREARKSYPGNLALIALLADLAQLQGRTAQTMQLLHRAIRLADKSELPVAGFWARLASACLTVSDKQARSAAEKANALAQALQPGADLNEQQIHQLRLQARNALAMVESEARHFDLAESLFRDVLDENPWFVPALQGLGQQQMQRGNIDEAIELFERIRQMEPARGFVWLINARHFPDHTATLDQLEKLARRPSLEGPAHSGILFHLAAAWEKRQQWEKAFQLAQEANEASRRLLRYDPAEHRQKCARIRHAFSRPLYQQRRDCGVDSTLPVYVVGMPRSGTTLVEQIIAGHSRICGAGELGIIPARIHGLNRWERQVGSGRAYPDCVDDLNPQLSASLANGILDELREFDPAARHIVDKLPHNFENIGFIKFLFPNARIISVRRDPRDIALSNYFADYQARHSGMGYAYDLTWIGEQLADHNLLMHHWQQLFPGEILEIAYEALVNDTEEQARRLLDYIGVDWEPQVLKFDRLKRPVKTASVWQVRQPIYTSSAGRWQHYRQHLAPLIRGTNARIVSQPVDMLSLPTPGMLTDAVALYREGRLDEAEYLFKKLLQHIPGHAAASFMTGLIYVHKGHVRDGIARMEKGYRACPWNADWRRDLARAYALAGETTRLASLQQRRRGTGSDTTDLPLTTQADGGTG
jgi:tetratricopeptide (TPR) repeat protein